MNGSLKWKLIVGFIVVFLAGGMTGAFFSTWHARRFFFEAHEPGMMNERMKNRLRDELNLNADQMNKVSPIVEKMSTQLDDIRKDTGKRVHQTFQAAHREIATFLTDEQKKKLEEMEKRHRRMHGPPPPWLHGGPPHGEDRED